MSAPVTVTATTTSPVTAPDGSTPDAVAPVVEGATPVTQAEVRHEGEYAAPKAFGLDATVWVSLAMAVFLLILAVKKVPTLIGRSLDGRIATIRTQLDEAQALRREAEALRAEYADKLAAADAERDSLRIRAEGEAAAIVARAETEARALVARRQKMAEERIAAAEAAAVGDVRAAAARAAADAARTVLRDVHGADADRQIVDRAIASLPAR